MTEPAFKATLSRYAKVYGFLWSLAETDLAKMTDDELAEFGVALDGPTQSNCWFATYDVVKILRPLYDGETYRRVSEKETPNDR